MAEETSALAHQRAVSPSFRPLTLRSAEEGKAAPRQKLRPASAPSGRGRECSPAHDRHRRKKPLACAPHRFSADLQAWGHHRTQSINKAVMARKEREQTMLGSYPERPRVSKNMKTFALSAFSMYPIMPFLAAMPQRSQGRTPARVSTQWSAASRCTSIVETFPKMHRCRRSTRPGLEVWCFAPPAQERLGKGPGIIGLEGSWREPEPVIVPCKIRLTWVVVTVFKNFFCYCFWDVYKNVSAGAVY